MGTTKIDDSILKKVEQIVKDNPVDFPTIKNVVDRAVRNFIERDI